MREKFREVSFNGNTNIRYKDAEGNVGIWHKNQREFLNEIETIVRAYQRQGIMMTNRTLYYQLVTTNSIPNAEAIYKRLCTFLTDARYGGYIDWSAIEDLGRVPERHSEWYNVAELIDSAILAYRLPRWNPQDRYIELFVEKQGMASVLQPIANKYHIYFGYNKGYSSAVTLYDLYKRIKEQLFDNDDEFRKDYKPCTILYLGDFDPSGLDMVRDIRERITEFLRKAFEKCSEPEFGDDEIDVKLGVTGCDDVDENAVFRVDHLALTSDQVQQYNPPPNPAKVTDPRAKGYVARYGRVSWELDSLRPDILRSIAEDGIRKYIDIDLYNEVIKREKVELNEFKRFFEGFMGSQRMKKILNDTKPVLQRGL